MEINNISVLRGLFSVIPVILIYPLAFIVCLCITSVDVFFTILLNDNISYLLTRSQSN